MAFDPTKIGAEFRYNDSTVTFGAGQTLPLVSGNPYRIAIFFQASTSVVTVRPILNPTLTLGLQVPANVQPIEITLHAHGPLCQQPWAGFASGAASIYILEVLWVPPGS